MTTASTPLFAISTIRIHADESIDHQELYEDHADMLSALQKGGPEEVRKLFEEKMEVGRRQYLRAFGTLQAEHALVRK